MKRVFSSATQFFNKILIANFFINENEWERWTRVLYDVAINTNALPGWCNLSLFASKTNFVLTFWLFYINASSRSSYNNNNNMFNNFFISSFHLSRVFENIFHFWFSVQCDVASRLPTSCKYQRKAREVMRRLIT